MKKALGLLVIALTLVVPAIPGQPREDPSLDARRAAIKGLYDAQELLLNELAGNTEASASLTLLLNTDPSGQMSSIDRNGVKDLSKSYAKFQTTHSSDSLSRFFSKNRELRRKYAPPFAGTLTGFWSILDSMASRQAVEAERDRDLLRQAASDARWIANNLRGVGISELDSKARDSFNGLFQLIAEYVLTTDPRILTALADDLRIIHAHCRSTGNRADQETGFTSETINTQNARETQWIVFALSHRNQVRRIGDPSSPVIGSLIPGRWFFYAEKDGRRSRGEWHTVSNGQLEPKNILIRF